MTYTESIDFIHSKLKFGSRPGLKTITELLNRLGNPQDGLKFIHVAGTNGKGSTSSYIADVLREKGYKTGLYTSPYIHRFTERIRVDGQDIDPVSLGECTALVRDAVADGLEATEFEIVTAIGFLYFARQKCDYVVLEVGLGGRFDATNVIRPPELAVITSISIDHTEYLGDTVEKIAFEKCGIIKSGTKAVTYCDTPKGADEVIKETCAERNVPLTICDKSKINIISRSKAGSVFTYDGREYEIQMPGLHQIYNAVTAINACYALGIDYEGIKNGIIKTKFGGRFETIMENPTVITDGAHNLGGAMALKETLCSNFRDKKIILVTGMLKDKEYEKCMELLAPVADLVITTEPDNPRKLTAKELLNTVKKYNGNVVAAPVPAEALKMAIGKSNDNTVICVCGSLYLIGSINAERSNL